MTQLAIKKYIKDPREVFIGWWTAFASGFLCFWGFGYTVYGFSALFKPISQELGFSRTATSFASSLTRLEGGLEAPIVGYLSDKHGPRLLVQIGVLIAGVGMILMYWVNSLWSFYVVWAVIIANGINISLGMPLDVALANWFIKKRGIVMSIKQVFSGLSGTFTLPLIMLLIVTVGWRMTCVVGGIVMIVIGFPLVHFFVKKHGPEHYGLLPDGAKAEISENEDTIDAVEKYALEAGEVDFTLQEAFRTKAFWMIIISYSFHGALYPVMNIHCIPFLTDMGMAETRAAATMAFYVTSSIPARYLGGLIVDRTSTNNIRFYLAAAFMLQAIGVTLFLFNQQSMFILYTFFFLYGIGMGAAMPMTPVMRARYFGRRHFGKIAGFSRALNMPIGFMGPIAAGWIFDASGTYILAFILLAILLAVSSFIIAIATPPKLHNAQTH